MYTTHYVLSAHAHNLTQYVGKGRQQAASSDMDINVAAGDSSYKLPCDYVMLKYIVHIVPGCIYNT